MEEPILNCHNKAEYEPAHRRSKKLMISSLLCRIAAQQRHIFATRNKTNRYAFIK